MGSGTPQSIIMGATRRTDLCTTAPPTCQAWTRGCCELSGDFGAPQCKAGALLARRRRVGTGRMPGRHSSGTSMNAPCEAFMTSDGYVLIVAGNDSLWGKLCRTISREELMTGPRFVDNLSRVRHRWELAGKLTETLKASSAAHWVERLQAAGVPSSPIRTLAQVVANPQVNYLGRICAVEHKELEGYRNIPLPLRWGGGRADIRSVPPALGADTREVLTELDRTPEDIEQRIGRHVVGVSPRDRP